MKIFWTNWKKKKFGLSKTVSETKGSSVIWREFNICQYSLKM